MTGVLGWGKGRGGRNLGGFGEEMEVVAEVMRCVFCCVVWNESF